MRKWFTGVASVKPKLPADCCCCRRRRRRFFVTAHHQLFFVIVDGKSQEGRDRDTRTCGSEGGTCNSSAIERCVVPNEAEDHDTTTSYYRRGNGQSSAASPVAIRHRLIDDR